MSDISVVNSSEYWDGRFSSDWEALQGPAQSRFFARLAIQHLPRWFVGHLRRDSLTLADWGCAQGDGTDVWAGFLEPPQIAGVDFSSVAIEQAARRYPAIRFISEDWLTDTDAAPDTFDFVFSSNTLEHFHKPYEVLRVLSQHARKGVVLALPFREDERIAEHSFSFRQDNVPLVLDNGFRLLHADVVDCRSQSNSPWHGEQIVLLYADPNWVDSLGLALGDVAIGCDDAEAQSTRWKKLLEDRECDVQALVRVVSEREGQLAGLKAEREGFIEGFSRVFAERDSQIALLHQVAADRGGQLARLNQAAAEQAGRLADATRSFDEAQHLLNRVLASRSWRLTKPLRFGARIGARRGISPDDRRRLVETLRHAYRRAPVPDSIRRGVRRLFGHFLDGYGALPPPPYANLSVASAQRTSVSAVTDPVAWSGGVAACVYAALERRYRVLCLPIIEWDFRFQRPQQLMTQFASAGHEVSYVSLVFCDAFSTSVVAERVQKIALPGPAGLNPYRDVLADDVARFAAEQLISRLGLDGPCPIVCIVELPFWEPLANLLRERTGCRIVYDCMDDHGGFSTNTATMLAGEQTLIGQADLVVASSRLLAERAEGSARRSILIQNACDFAHFASVSNKPAHDIEAPRIGYFGAIADWFDVNLLAELAKLRPQWRFELIGSTFSADTTALDALSNVELLGERSYRDLPGLMRDWDCCIIPFLRCPLTEATNPVKVYEMLAAGKPVVAVALPELVPLAEHALIRLANNAMEFSVEIEESLRNDTPELVRARRDFAEQNTWKVRFATLDQEIRTLWPLASIVVVTFHNLALNRACLSSVLDNTSYPNIEVVVVDNGSEDGTPEYLRDLAARESRVRVVLNEGNLGFAGANNQGIAAAQGDYVCLLNNDTVVTPWWLTTLIGHLQRNPEVGLVGPVTNAIGNEAKIDVGYSDLKQMPAWAAQYCAMHRGRLVPIPMLAFFCVAMRRSVIEKVGVLDERFGKGMFEDDDYCRRVREVGLDVRCAHDSFVHHWQKASFNLLGSEEYLDTFLENRDQYQAKWGIPERDQSVVSGGAVSAFDVALRVRESKKIGIIFAPSIGWGVHLFQRPHHLATALAGLGHVVVFDVSNAYDPIEGFKEIAPRLFLYRGDAEALRQFPNTAIWAFSYNYGYRDFFPATTPVIYDWIDDLEVFPYDQQMLRSLHERALREAVIVGCVAKVLLDDARQTRPDAIYLPNAVEYERFADVACGQLVADSPDLAEFLACPGPLCGYYGALAEWFDYGLLEEVAVLNPEWRFLLIGPDYDGSIKKSNIKRLGNIHWAGPKDYKTLPAYLSAFDVAMIPFVINDITRATSPLKLYEYFAGGKPVICTPMPECMAFPVVKIVRDAAEFSVALREARAANTDMGFKARLRALGRENSWVARAEAVLSLLAPTVGTGGEVQAGRGQHLVDSGREPCP